jgi:hypothetical protein
MQRIIEIMRHVWQRSEESKLSITGFEKITKIPALHPSPFCEIAVDLFLCRGDQTSMKASDQVALVVLCFVDFSFIQ